MVDFNFVLIAAVDNMMGSYIETNECSPYNTIFSHFSHEEITKMYYIKYKERVEYLEKLKKLREAFTALPINGIATPCLTLEQFNEIVDKHS